MSAQSSRTTRACLMRGAVFLSLLLPAVVGTILPAKAQQQDQAAASGAPGASDQIETITVTATRQGREDIQKVPMAVTALNPTQLSTLNLTSLSDYTRLAPSLSM